MKTEHAQNPTIDHWELLKFNETKIKTYKTSKASIHEDIWQDFRYVRNTKYSIRGRLSIFIFQ